MVVRHPFERIMSAYVDKLEDYDRDLRYRGGYYYAMYGADIVNTYRNKYKQSDPGNPLFDRKEPSFVEFVNYLLDTPVERYDEHWRPQYILCPPCHFNFDVIVKMETFTRYYTFYEEKISAILLFPTTPIKLSRPCLPMTLMLREKNLAF